MRFLGKLLGGLIILTLVIVGIALFVFWPDAEVNPPSDPPTRDAMTFIEKAIAGTAAVSADLTTLSLRADSVITEAQLQQLLDFWYDEADADVQQKVEGYRVIARDGYAEVHVRARILPFLSGQAQLNIVPAYADGKLRVEVISARIGRISVPPEMVLDYISVDLRSAASLEFPITLPRPLQLDSLELTSGGLRLTISARVTSLGDLIQLGKTLGATLQ